MEPKNMELIHWQTDDEGDDNDDAKPMLMPTMVMMLCKTALTIMHPSRRAFYNKYVHPIVYSHFADISTHHTHILVDVHVHTNIHYILIVIMIGN